MIDSYVRGMQDFYESNNRQAPQIDVKERDDGVHVRTAPGPSSDPSAAARDRRPSRRDRLPQDLATLAAWFLGGNVPKRAERERLRSRLKTLGVDVPPSGQRPAK